MFVIFFFFLFILFIFLLFCGIFDVRLGKKKRRPEDAEQELPPDYDAKPTEQPDYQATPEPQHETKGKPDLAAEFERRLKKRPLEQSQQGNSQERQRVYVDKRQQRERQDKQRVHYDGEVQHEGKGRVHRDNEALKYDKSNFYRVFKGDYSYNEELFNKQAAAFSARMAQQELQAKPKLKLKHAARVNGFIMAQVLDKPRSLKSFVTEDIFKHKGRE